MVRNQMGAYTGVEDTANISKRGFCTCSLPTEQVKNQRKWEEAVHTPKRQLTGLIALQDEWYVANKSN